MQTLMRKIMIQTVTRDPNWEDSRNSASQVPADWTVRTWQQETLETQIGSSGFLFI